MNQVTPSFQPETGQVMLWGSSAGVAGEAFLTPVPDLKLAFDRADGYFCWAIVRHVTTAGSACVGEQVAAMLTRLFGPEAPGAVEDAARWPEREPPGTDGLTPDPGLAGTLSSLARLEAVRATSPVLPGSPWWAAETAKLAERAGLPALASAQGGPRLAIPPPAPVLSVAAEVESLKKEQAYPARLQWMLGPRAVREGPFRLGLTPYSDLIVRQRGLGLITIEALLAPGADCGAVGAYQVRVTDPEIRRILAQASFAVAGARARAELQPPFSLDEVPESWIEVVRDSKCPAGSLKEHRDMRAQRWADAALRAQRAPAGLDSEATPEDWSALAIAAWEQCSFDWAAAGNADRAYLALRRRAAILGADIPRAPSRTAAEIADQMPLAGPAYLAEDMG
jgi:hypothetical protein